MDGAPKINMGHVTWLRLFQKRFVVRMLELVMTDLCTKFEIYVDPRKATKNAKI